MKKIFFIAFFAIWISQLAQAALITGVMNSALTGDKIEVFVPHYYLDGKSSTYSNFVETDGRFKIQVVVPEPQVVFITYNESKLPIFLSNTDTLTIQTNAFQFPLVVNFGGKAGANNTLLTKYLNENPSDYNEFNNIRYKIGQYWANVEAPMNSRMEELDPEGFKAYLDTRKVAGFALMDEFLAQHPRLLSPDFKEWLASEVIFNWAYHLLFYGHVYGGRYMVQPEFFDFLYEAPVNANTLGSDWYRQFLMASTARKMAKKEPLDQFWGNAYQYAGEILDGKPLAFLRSEIILVAFSRDRFKEISPLYRDFLEKNTYTDYDTKVEDLYQKMVRTSFGSGAPDFFTNTLEGKSLSLSSLRGKVVYVNFWATWCGSCLRKMEFFDEFSNELKEYGVEIVNISTDENRDSWKNVLAERGFKGYHVLSSTGVGTNIATTFGVEAVPQYFIIRRDGTFADKAGSNQPNDIREKLLEVAKR